MNELDQRGGLMVGYVTTCLTLAEIRREEGGGRPYPVRVLGAVNSGRAAQDGRGEEESTDG